MHIDHVRYVRLLTASHQKPAGGIRHLAVTGSTVMRAATVLPATDLYLGLELIMESPATTDVIMIGTGRLPAPHDDQLTDLIIPVLG
ncbi:MAG TPA: hypothetical protein VIT65_16705 [Microlunatus sp.]